MNTHFPRTRGLVNVRSETRADQVLTELATAFEQFRSNNDSRVDGLITSIDEINATMAALRVGGGVDGKAPQSAAAARDERIALGGYAKTGADAALKPMAAMSTDSQPDGGYTVFPTISKNIQGKTFDLSPLGRLARYETVNTGNAFEEPLDPSDIEAEWTGEREARPNLAGPKLQYLTVPLEEIYTSQPVTQRLLDDSDFNIGAWLENKIGDKFARSEGAAFVNGDGVKKPRGLLTYDISTEKDGVRGWFDIQYIATGQSAGFTSANPADVLIDTVYSLRAPYRTNARWLMNLSTAGAVRKLKDAEGRFIWADAREGMPATLCGFPVELDEEMPDIGADSLSIAFGDLQRAYIVVGRPGLKLLRDPYTAKPNVIFYAYRRVGGGLQNGEAVKLNRPGIAGGQFHQVMLPWVCRPAWRSSALRPRRAGCCR